MPMGIFLMFLGTLLGIIRVLAGVHFPRDVIVGGIMGILIGILAWNIVA